ncbi:MAG: hypothetical protein JRN52_12045 [Nitrososphaerota archaeon]|nr:hypothetical protein [Nitrososphaerota archaeon]
MTAYYKASAFVNSNPQQAAVIAGPAFDVSTTAMEQTFTVIKFSTNSTFTPQIIQGIDVVRSQLLALNVVSSAPPTDQLYTTEFQGVQ